MTASRWLAEAVAYALHESGTDHLVTKTSFDHCVVFVAESLNEKVAPRAERDAAVQLLRKLASAYHDDSLSSGCFANALADIVTETDSFLGELDAPQASDAG